MPLHQYDKFNLIKLPDAIIPATAFVNNMELISRNINDFKNVEGLHTIDPHKIA